MFGGSRRQRPPVQPLTKETANPNAATAAASAFMRREPATSLSSAAAAAALKARPTTPTNVAEVQSKRALRRAGSVSSTRSQDRQPGKHQLQRSPSTGSMTERTFRSPSPGRSPAPVPHHVPPVPSLPKNDPQRPSSTHAASAALQTQPFRTASQKAKDGQQGSWFAGATSGDASNIRTTDLVLNSPGPNDARPGSISPSINFSYPRARMEPQSPTGASSEAAMVYDPNSRRMVPKIDLLNKQYAVRQASEKPVKKKKKQQSKSGTHLAQGTMNRTKVASTEGSPHETARTSQPPQHPSSQKVTAAKSVQPTIPVEQTATESSPKQPVVEPITTSLEPTKLDLRVVDGATVMPAPDSPGPAALSRQPVALPEEAEAEAEAEEDGEEDDDVANESAHHEGGVSVKDYAVPVVEPYVPSEPPAVPAKEQPTPVLVEQRLPQQVQRTRVESQSPARSPGRSAHFAPTADQLLIRHEPPPRSLSPRKSALKNASSSRGASPSDDGSEASASVAGSLSREDALQARKKAVRVSFNDENTVVVGESASPPDTDSPIVPSPQSNKKLWQSVMKRYQKKESPLVDDEETMSPRPALPLFGSVREKKPREPDNERPLVRPSERTWSPPSHSPIVNEQEASGLSSDAAIGAAITQDQASRNAANISKAREPLPPVVQSIESTGYLSNSPLSSDDDLDDSDTVDSSQFTETNMEAPYKAESSKVPTAAVAMEEEGESSQSQNAQSTVVTNEQHTEPTFQMSPSVSQQAKTETVPAISITNPSPLPKEDVEISPVSDYFDVPGGFPEDENNDVTTTTEPVSHEATKPSLPSISTDVEPVLAPTSPMADIEEEEESTEGSSIYSDAYEDLSDVDGEGFMSLDAVLTSPPESKTAKIFEKTVSQAQEQIARDRDGPAPPVTKKDEVTPKTSQDWENAKVYWRSLSADKRRQLETEAMEEAAEDADQEATPKPKKKTKKKRKSADRDAILATTRQNGEREGGVTSGKARQAEPAVKPFKKSMRGPQPERVEEVQTQAGGMRKSLRTNGSAAESNKTTRPSSFHPGSNTQASTGKLKRPMSSEGRPTSSGGLASAGMKPSLRRRGSDSSESSFRRSRPSTGEGFGFRRTMRSTVQEPEVSEPHKGSGRFSLRSLSPTGSAFRRSSFTSSPPAGGKAMRQSLRGDTLEAKPKRFSTFGRSSGKKAKGKLGSRFADSSDEDDGGIFASAFRSRFADSSDDDDGAVHAPRSQGMAKTMRTSQGANSAAAAALGVRPSQPRADSPDLPEENGIYQPKRDSTMNGGERPPVRRNRSGRGEMPLSSPGVVGTEGIGNRPSHTRRGSFMSSILRRKKDSGGKISRELSESAARRDTKLERSTEELSMLRSNSGSRPHTHKREPSWPLPEEQEADELPGVNGQVEKRPATSSGAPSAPRGFLKRRTLSHQEVLPIPPAEPHERAETPSEATTTTGKKKKFGTLRKMFRLHD